MLLNQNAELIKIERNFDAKMSCKHIFCFNSIEIVLHITNFFERRRANRFDCELKLFKLFHATKANKL